MDSPPSLPEGKVLTCIFLWVYSTDNTNYEGVWQQTTVEGKVH